MVNKQDNEGPLFDSDDAGEVEHAGPLPDDLPQTVPNLDAAKPSSQQPVPPLQGPPAIVGAPADLNPTNISAKNQRTPLPGETGSDISLEETITDGASASKPDLFNQIWGDFEVQEMIGQGGMGSVYKGRQISLDRAVALKVLPPHLARDENFRRRFQLEAKAVAKVSSPHIVQMYGAGEYEGIHYFAMEYVDGTDLGARVRENFRPSHDKALDIIYQAAKGLAAAWEYHIVHRDIKPANMMVTDKGLVKIMDFGLVKLLNVETSGLTMAGTIMGTVSYFSPEQGRGEICDQRTDLYALGVVLYQLLTTKLPFMGDPTSVIYQHVHVDPVPPKEVVPDIPESYQAIVLKCMQKKQEDRYQNASELIADIEQVKRGLPPITALSDPKGLRANATIIRSKPFSFEKKSSTLAVVATCVAIGSVVAAFITINWFNKTEEAEPISIRLPIRAEGPRIQVPKPELLTEARSLIEQGQHERSRQLAYDVLREYPESTEWHGLVGELNGYEAVALLDQAAGKYKLGDYVVARQCAIDALRLLPENPQALSLISKIDEKEQQLASIKEQLNGVKERLDRGEHLEAMDELARIQETAPRDPELWLEIANVVNLANRLPDDRADDTISPKIAEFRDMLRDVEITVEDLEKSLQHIIDEVGADFPGVSELTALLDTRRQIQAETQAAIALKALRDLFYNDQQSTEALATALSEFTSEFGDEFPEIKGLNEMLAVRKVEEQTARDLQRTAANASVADAGTGASAKTTEASPSAPVLATDAAIIATEIRTRIENEDSDLKSLEAAMVTLETFVGADPALIAELRSLLNVHKNGLRDATIAQKADEIRRACDDSDTEVEELDQLITEFAAMVGDEHPELSELSELTEQFREDAKEREIEVQLAELEQYFQDHPDELEELKDALQAFTNFAGRDRPELRKFEAHIRDKEEARAKREAAIKDSVDRLMQQMTDVNNDPAELESKMNQFAEAYGQDRPELAELRETLEAFKVEKREYEIKQQFVDLKTRLEAATVEIDNLESAVTDFVAFAGDDRPESGELVKLVGQRRDQEEVRDILRQIDQSVLAGSEAALAPLITELNFRSDLVWLFDRPGLKFQHEFRGAVSDTGHITATAVLHHALAVTPELELYYKYRFEKPDDIWTITAVERVQELP